jgi:hypothetical protein
MGVRFTRGRGGGWAKIVVEMGGEGFERSGKRWGAGCCGEAEARGAV